MFLLKQDAVTSGTHMSGIICSTYTKNKSAKTAGVSIKLRKIPPEELHLWYLNRDRFPHTALSVQFSFAVPDLQHFLNSSLSWCAPAEKGICFTLCCLLITQKCHLQNPIQRNFNFCCLEHQVYCTLLQKKKKKSLPHGS